MSGSPQNTPETGAVWQGVTALRTSLVPIDTLEPTPGNPRRGDVPAIAGSLTRFGQVKPVVVTGERITAGHHLVEAARTLGWTHIAVVDGEFADGEEARAFLLADNRTSELGYIDDEALAVQLAALRNHEGIGYTAQDVADLDARLAALRRPDADPNAVVEPPAAPVSVRGEIYELGPHRLMCGDATDSDDIAALLGDERNVCIFTSPPYAVNLGYASYDDSIENLRTLLLALAETWRDRVAAGGFCVVNFGDVISGSTHADANEPCEYPMAVEHWPIFRRAGWILHSRRIWAKPHARVAAPWTASSNRAASDWEHLWTWKRPGAGLNERRDPSYLGVWDTSRGENVTVGKETHPAGFPTILAEWVIAVYTDPGAVVCDPLAGTGTTLIAAERTGRRARMMEIDPGYCDVIRQRYADFVEDPSLAPEAVAA